MTVGADRNWRQQSASPPPLVPAFAPSFVVLRSCLTELSWNTIMSDDDWGKRMLCEGGGALVIGRAQGVSFLRRSV